MISNNIKIGIDTYGSDIGETIFVQSVYKLLCEGLDVHFYLYGNENVLNDLFSKFDDFNNYKNRVNIINSTQNIEINEHPVFALRSKTDSSMFKSGQDLISNKIDGLISAGSTGAYLALGQLYVKTFENIKRPAVAAIMPTINNPLLLIDSGANMDPEPEWLYDYAKLGIVYMQNILKIKNPRVGLLNVGKEETKGDKLLLSTYSLLKNDKSINFIGNVEAREFISGVCDVLVSDGKTGNILLKTYETSATTLLNILKQTIKSSLLNKIAGLILKKPLKQILKKFDVDVYGGAILVGVSKPMIKCHGNSNEKSIYYAIKQLYNFIYNDTITKMSVSISRR